MNLTELFAATNREEYTHCDNSIYGENQGYPFRLSLIGNRATAFFTLEARPNMEARRCVKAAVKEYGGRLVDSGNPRNVAISFRDASAAENILYAATTALEENGCRVPEECPYCGAIACDCAAAVTPQSYVPAHMACVVHSVHEKTHAKDKKEFALRGLPGALLGALPAMIPALATTLFWDNEFAFLYMIIPIGAMFGYRKMCGRSGFLTLLCVTVSSLVAAFAIEQLWFYKLVAEEYALLPNILDTIKLYFAVFTFEDILQSAGMMLLFIFIGIVCVSKDIFGGIARAAVKTADTITPRAQYREAKSLLAGNAPQANVYSQYRAGSQIGGDPHAVRTEARAEDSYAQGEMLRERGEGRTSDTDRDVQESSASHLAHDAAKLYGSQTNTVRQSPLLKNRRPATYRYDTKRK